MLTPPVVTFLQAAGIWILVLGLIAATAFLIWCLVALVLWLIARRKGGETPPPATDPEWFESLPEDEISS